MYDLDRTDPEWHRSLLDGDGLDFDTDNAQHKLILKKYGNWLQGLAEGDLEPFTEAQQHFVFAARGKADPITEFEHAWCLYQAMIAKQEREQVEFGAQWAQELNELHGEPEYAADDFVEYDDAE